MTTAVFLATLVCVALALSAGMSMAWVIWRSTRNSGWVDTIWTFSVGAVGLAGALLPPTGAAALDSRRALVAAFAALWASAAWRSHRTTHAWHHRRPALCPAFERLGQRTRRARCSCYCRSRHSLAFHSASPWCLPPQIRNPRCGCRIGSRCLVMAIAILGEATADRQLRRFGADPANRGKVCDVGLWRWSRHPNYFFEWFGWLAYPLLAIGAWEWGWLALAAPACMYWLLAYVSGIPPLEEHMLATRGDAYRAYQARTSAFFPLPPG